VIGGFFFILGGWHDLWSALIKRKRNRIMGRSEYDGCRMPDRKVYTPIGDIQKMKGFQA